MALGPLWHARTFGGPRETLDARIAAWLNSLPPTSFVSVTYAPSTEDKRLDFALVLAREEK